MSLSELYEGWGLLSNLSLIPDYKFLPNKIKNGGINYQAFQISPQTSLRMLG